VVYNNIIITIIIIIIITSRVDCCLKLLSSIK